MDCAHQRGQNQMALICNELPCSGSAELHSVAHNREQTKANKTRYAGYLHKKG